MEDHNDIVHPALKTIIKDHATMDIKVAKAIKKMKSQGIDPKEVFYGRNRPEHTV
jgi:hypothetical protein